MNFCIVVKNFYGEELYTVSGPYSTYKEASKIYDLQHYLLSDTLNRGEYLSIVVKRRTTIFI